MTESEIWKDVVGFEGWYEVSDQGRIMRVARGPSTDPGFVLRPSLCNGYLVVHLSCGTNAGRKLHGVHRIVAAAFHGVCPAGHVVNHIDADRTNNKPDNLEYLTHTQNRAHTVRMNRQAKGEKNGRAVLTEVDVRWIREIGSRMPLPDVASRFGVSESCIKDVLEGKHWKHIA